tara:strand:- start:10 stop:342 length:333 start_codon:yes stop_codon:yes gene_type:complete
MDNDIIDLELGKKLINGSEERARDMLTMLMDMLPEHEKNLKAAHENQDKKALIAEAHKLRGGVCYCGTPQLQKITTELETALKQGKENIDTLYTDLLAAIESFKTHYHRL